MHRTYMQLHKYRSMILHTFHPRSSLNFLSLLFISRHFTALHYAIDWWCQVILVLGDNNGKVAANPSLEQFYTSSTKVFYSGFT